MPRKKLVDERFPHRRLGPPDRQLAEPGDGEPLAGGHVRRSLGVVEDRSFTLRCQPRSLISPSNRSA
jgi:hypothetical protein